MSSYSEGAQKLMDEGHLVGALVMAQMGQTADATNQVIENLEFQVKALKAELALIRDQISNDYSHPWIPQPVDVLKHLWPGNGEILAKMKESA